MNVVKAQIPITAVPLVSFRLGERVIILSDWRVVSCMPAVCSAPSQTLVGAATGQKVLSRSPEGSRRMRSKQ